MNVMEKLRATTFALAALMRTRTLRVAILLLLVCGFLEAGTVSNRKDANNLSKSIERAFQERETQLVDLDADASLEGYLAYAAINNPGLKAAFYRWKAELERIPAVTALPDPMVSYGYYIENVETRVGPQNQRFSLKQSFPWFGTLDKKGEAAFESANVAYQKYQKEKLRLFYQVKSAYYDYYYLGRDIELTRDNMELLKYWESVARTKYKAGLKQHPDVIKAQVELGKLEDRLLSLEEMTVPTAARLRAVLNLPDSIELPIPGTIAPGTPLLDRDSVLAKTLANNPDLIAIDHLIRKEKAEISLTGKASYPNFTLGVDYLETGQALNPSLDESGKDPWLVSVSVNLPIWFGKNKAKRNAARARHKMAQHNLEDAKNALAAVTERVVFEYEDAQRKISLYRDGLIPKAEQSLNVSYTAYQVGESDFLTLLDAQRQLLDFQLKLEKSLTESSKKLAELEMITGHQIDYNQKP